ncbi:MAG: hypothetical protein RMY34_15945 [Aulosira sp. DedQUE10]|nr:hypothetical protein [Aulosira sp. DedQUE10]
MTIPDASILSGLRVLVVDDDLDTCVWLTYALELYGIEVHSAFTALNEPETRFSRSQVWFDQWLLKPVDIEKLVKAIAHLTGRSSLSCELIFSS